MYDTAFYNSVKMYDFSVSVCADFENIPSPYTVLRKLYLWCWKKYENVEQLT
jgi:hypothetical protein